VRMLNKHSAQPGVVVRNLILLMTIKAGEDPSYMC